MIKGVVLMVEIPTRFKKELEEMDMIYSTIQDIRVFKNNYDQLLLNKCERDNLGRIVGDYPWSFVSGNIMMQLKETSPSEGMTIAIDFSKFDTCTDVDDKKVNCGQVSHVFTEEEPYWSLSFN